MESESPKWRKRIPLSPGFARYAAHIPPRLRRGEAKHKYNNCTQVTLCHFSVSYCNSAKYLCFVASFFNRIVRTLSTNLTSS